MMEHFPDAHVTIHVEPCDLTCKPVCLKGCLIKGTSRERAAGVVS